MRKEAIRAPQALNEAYHYPRPSAFSRGIRVDIKGITFLFISGTASVNESGESIHVGDLPAQTRRTLENITALLKSEGADWHDVVRTTCYLKNMERDYSAFNEVRTQFYTELELNPLPASTCVEAGLCREELLVEIEAIAVMDADRKSGVEKNRKARK